MSPARKKKNLSEASLFEFRTNVKKTAIWMAIVLIAGAVLGYVFIYCISFYNYREICNSNAQAYADDFFNGTGVRTAADMSTIFFSEDGRMLLQSNSITTVDDYQWIFDKHPIDAEHQPNFWLVAYNDPFDFVMISGIIDSIEHAPNDPLHIYYVWGNANIGLAALTFVFAFVCVVIIAFLVLLLYQWKLCEMDTMRRDYVSNVSHELKTPIASIKALTQTLSDGLAEDQETRSRYYGIILGESNRLERAVVNLLELNRLQARIERMEREPVDAQELIASVCEKFSVRCDDMGIRFIDSTEGIGDVTLYTNARRINELLEILLDNAVKFVSTDGGEIRFEARRSMHKVSFCVRDNGIGISADKLPHIFDRFYKVNDHHGGSGLGLSIAQEICKQLDEDIWVKSKEGEGTAFFFTVSIYRG